MGNPCSGKREGRRGGPPWVALSDVRGDCARAVVCRGVPANGGALVATVVGSTVSRPASWLGRAGGPCRGRCKYVPVSSMAPSMAPTPLHGPPARPLTVSCGPATEWKKKIKGKSGSRAALAHALVEPSPRSACCCPRPKAAEHGLGSTRPSTKTDAAKPRPSFKFRPDNPTLFDPSPEICQRWGGRVSRTVGAMDGAIEPPWMGLRRVPLAPPGPPS